MDINRRIAYFPRFFFLSYFILTLLMFTFSPWQWQLASPVKFYLFNLGVLCAFYFGYRQGIKNFNFRFKSPIDNRKLERIFRYSLILSIVFLYPKFLFQLHVGSASISFIFNSIVTGFASPELAYAVKHETVYADFLTLSNPLILFYNLFLPLLYIAIPLGIYLWKSLSGWEKCCFLIILIGDILSFVAIGTNKGIFDIILIGPWLIVAKKPRVFLDGKFNFNKYRGVIFFGLILGLGMAYFAQGNIGRKQDSFYYEKSTNKMADLNSPIFIVLPKPLHNGYLAIDSYLTQGYYALGLALDMDFNFTYGLGHSYFLTSLGEKFLGKGAISAKTYEARVETKHGWSQYGKWHSIYVPLANDLTFVGVIILVFFIAFFFSQVWLDVVGFRNIISIPVFCLFIIILFYFPANNQVLGFQGSSIVFWSLFLIWRLARNKVNKNLIQS